MSGSVNLRLRLHHRWDGGQFDVTYVFFELLACEKRNPWRVEAYSIVVPHPG